MTEEQRDVIAIDLGEAQHLVRRLGRSVGDRKGLTVVTAQAAAPDPMQDGLRRLGSHWGWILFFGIVTLGAGIMAVVWPDRTVLVVAVLFGFHLIFTGIYRLVGAFALHVEGGAKWVLVIGGTLGILVGILCLQNVVQTVAVLTIFLGFWWIFDGIVRLITAISDATMPDRGLAIASGIISGLAGIAVVAYPGSSLFFLTIVLGMWLIVFGLFELVAAFRLRKIAKSV